MPRSDLQKSIDIITRESGQGGAYTSMQDATRGINHSGYGSRLPANNEQYGLTFFTRPELNLSYDNIISQRKTQPLATTDRNSIHYAIRAMLDPTGHRDEVNGYETPMVDPDSPFLPILTNTLTSISGWPDTVLDTYSTAEGRIREQHAIVDGAVEIANVFDLTCNFRNVVGDPISWLFYYWTLYAAYVHENRLVPYPNMYIEDRMDYSTRIYRLVLDASRTFVTKIAAVGGGFPVNDVLGQSFNFNSEIPTNTETEQITIQFNCSGAILLDPVLITDFNATVAKYCPPMAGPEFERASYKDVPRWYTDEERKQAYHKLVGAEKATYSSKGYPRINAETMELEWWVPLVQYAKYKRTTGDS